MKKEIERVLNEALDVLLENDANERTISHMLAGYIEPHFRGWNVDCEYNRNHDDPKRLEILRRNVSNDETPARTVFPDIIVHKRNTDENLLVIEMKKQQAKKRTTSTFINSTPSRNNLATSLQCLLRCESMQSQQSK